MKLHGIKGLTLVVTVVGVTIFINILSTATEKFIDAIATSIVGIGVCAIAFQQWRTNHLKVKFDYFEKRHAIYLGIRNHIDYAMAHGAMNHSSIVSLNSDTRDAPFLFGKDVVDYIQELREHAAKLNYACTSYRDYTQEQPPGYKHNEIVQIKHNEMSWYSEQHKRLVELFKPYLDLSTLV